MMEFPNFSLDSDIRDIAEDLSKWLPLDSPVLGTKVAASPRNNQLKAQGCLGSFIARAQPFSLFSVFSLYNFPFKTLRYQSGIFRIPLELFGM